ncbi:PrgI family protein [Patescibacteria group bacterium]|nr:PrgI family protein [Patescibacteria group bacterium]
MEYQVPQFIDVEDKIVGPLTLKQFIYLAGGGGLCVILFVSLPTLLALLFSAPIAGLAFALAFYKVNGKPFIEVLEAGFNYYSGGKFFLWKHADSGEQGVEEKTAARAAAAEAVRDRRSRQRLTRGKLSELAWSLDVKSAGDVSRTVGS